VSSGLGNEGMTPARFGVLRIVAEFIRCNGYSPSYADLCDATGLSSLATIHGHVKTLQHYGYVEGLFNRTRSLRVTRKGLRALSKVEVLTNA
jgi:SOS-response transcriptional repressor LexA